MAMATLSLAVAISSAQHSQLPIELKKEISDWRTNTLTSIETAKYWEDLKTLGEKVGNVHANRIVESKANDIDSAIALMAYKVWLQPEKVDEISGWYGVWAVNVDRKLRGIHDDEQWNRFQRRLNSYRVTNVVTALREQHINPDYAYIWEAWMLSPSSPERYRMRQRMNEALVAIGNDRSIAILVEKCRILPMHWPPPVHVAAQTNPSVIQEESRREAGEIVMTIRAIGGKAAISGMLDYLHVAESAGYAKGGAYGDRFGVILLLSSSYNPRQLREMPEWAESLRDPTNPEQLVPWDDKWKEFKPIIEEMLQNPDDLRPEDTQTLKAALDAMPK